MGAEEREELMRYYEGMSAEDRRRRILIQPAYRDLYNEITQAHRDVDQPWYFWEKWVPRLGPVPSVLYMRLRQLCFYRPGTPEHREYCWPRQDTLAESIGIKNRETIREPLRELERWGFVKREPQYRTNQETGGTSRRADRYLVYFEIPLTPDDAAEILLREVAQESGQAVHKAEFPPDTCGGKSATEHVAEFPPAELNVQRFQRSTLSGPDFRQIPPDPGSGLVDELVEELSDPGSRKFFQLVADKLPEGRIRLVLSETRSARAEGRLRGAPGAYFTGAIRRVALELGITL